MIEKDNVVYHLKTFSSGKKKLSSLYFFEHYGEYRKYESLREAGKDLEAGNMLKNFQRRLNSLVNEIIQDQKTYKQFIILSDTEGYWIPKTEEEYHDGISYLYKKEEALRERRKFIDEIRRINFSKRPSEIDIFSRM
jgi:hypothetical protein